MSSKHPIVTKATAPGQRADAPVTALLDAGVVLGDWRIDGIVGVGGMGTVYAATHLVIGKRAAIKVVRSELVADALTAERFLQEARVVNQVGHAAIVDIFHIGQLDDGRPYLVMELLQGKTLGRRMAEGRILPDEAIDLLLEVCAGLAAAHACGVVHRDLKPDNIFLADGPSGTEVKLVDWGIAKLMDGRPTSCALTTTGTLVGTPQYMSPEQARGKAVDGRTDVYALGAIAYELFLEGPPFHADNIADLVTMQLREPPPPPSELWPDIPEALERLLLAMLSKRPEGRPSLEEVQTTLRELRGEIGTRRGRARRRAISSPGAFEALDRARTWGMSRAMESAHIDRARSGRHRVAQALVATAALLVLAAAGLAAPRVVRDPDALAGAARAAAPAPVPSSVEPPVPAPAATPRPASDARLATLDIRVEPADARVRVDGASAPVEDGRVVLPVEPGVIELAISAPGHRGYRRSLEVGAGTVLLDVSLRPRPEPRSLQHKPESRRAVLDVDPDGTIDPFE